MPTQQPIQQPALQPTLNLGILAHIDAGKTSLTERLLHAAGVIDEIGRVDDGSTQTDTLALERRRGITIKAAVVSFEIAGVTVNLVDTPGHPDFIAEVERVLSVLDGAVLVVSAVEGVQAQTRILMRTLRRLGLPTLVFVNKIDRLGARPDAVAAEVRDRLGVIPLPLAAVSDPGMRGAAVHPHGADDPAFVECLREVLADGNERLLGDYVVGRTWPGADLFDELCRQTGQIRVHPLLYGSAITGAGVPELLRQIPALLPIRHPNPDAPAAGRVFKIERGRAGEKVAFVALRAGTLRVRDRLLVHGAEEKITAARLFADGCTVPTDAVPAGRIAQLWGLGGITIGDPIGAAGGGVPHHFAPPSLETVVGPATAADRAPLHLALTQLAEQDPLIDLRTDELRGETSVSLYGEVQKEVIQATLAEDFGVRATFRESTTICIERLLGCGSAVERMKVDPNPFLATCGLRVEPAPIGAGVTFGLDVERGAMPSAFFAAVEETVRLTLGQGLHGWDVPDCRVVMTHSGYAPRQSHMHATFDKSMSTTAGDFRKLVPLVLTTALRRARTQVCQPVHRFSLEIPADTFGAVVAAVSRLGAVPHSPTVTGGTAVVEGDVAAGLVHTLELLVPPLTRGEAVLESAFDRYEPVAGPAPARPRTDANPLDRKGYLLRVERRVTLPTAR